jgi:hypothetical protein
MVAISRLEHMFDMERPTPIGSTVSTLRSVLEEFRRDDLATVADAALEDDFAELHQVIQALQVERLRRLGEIARRRTYERDGFLSCVAWLAGRFRMAFSAAGRDVRMARAFRHMPSTREGMASGEISSCSARVLVSAFRANPVAFRESEEMLMQAARALPVRHLERAVTHWRLASQDGSDVEEQR